MITYAPKTIAAGLDSRNLNHAHAFAGLKDLRGERPLVLDRELSYLELYLHLVEEHVNFVDHANLEAQQGLHIYLSRMKIDETFRDLKSLLGIGRWMNKQDTYMEKMLALLLLVFAIGLLIGECLRDRL